MCKKERSYIPNLCIKMAPIYYSSIYLNLDPSLFPASTGRVSPSPEGQKEGKEKRKIKKKRKRMEKRVSWVEWKTKKTMWKSTSHFANPFFFILSIPSLPRIVISDFFYILGNFSGQLGQLVAPLASFFREKPWIWGIHLWPYWLQVLEILLNFLMFLFIPTIWAIPALWATLLLRVTKSIQWSGIIPVSR